MANNELSSTRTFSPDYVSCIGIKMFMIKININCSTLHAVATVSKEALDGFVTDLYLQSMFLPKTIKIIQLRVQCQTNLWN